MLDKIKQKYFDFSKLENLSLFFYILFFILVGILDYCIIHNLILSFIIGIIFISLLFIFDIFKTKSIILFFTKKAKHNFKIYQLQKKYNSFNKYPSTKSRIFKVFIFTIIAIIIIYFIETEIAKNIFKYFNIDTSTQALIKLKSLIITAPIIFIIWVFRDNNKLLELENTRKDTNLKEFQQLQQWATGNIGDNESSDNKIALQISALHSLRGYLRGEYGESFRRGAYEIFRSTLETQHNQILEQVKNKKHETIRDAINECQLTKQLNIIASEEWFNLLINHDFPTQGISLVGVDLNNVYLSHIKYGKELNLTNANLKNVYFNNIVLQNINFYKANIIDSVIHNTVFKDIQIFYSNFSGSDFFNTDFENINIISAKFTGSKLEKVNFINSNFICGVYKEVDFIATNLIDVNFGNKNLKCLNLVGAYFKNDNCNNLVERISIRIGKDTNININYGNAFTGVLSKQLANEIVEDYINEYG